MSDPPLRILHLLSHDRIKSGGAFQAILLARAQRGRGAEVRFGYNAGRQPGQAREAFAPLLAEGFECVPFAMQHLARFLGARRFQRHVDRVAPDVIHAHRERAMRFAVSALSGRRGPVLLAQKGNCYHSDPQTAAAYRSSRLDGIVAVAEAVRNVLVDFDQVPPDKVRVIYGSFDPERFRERQDRKLCRAELQIAESAKVVGILANLDRKKGHRLFFQMVSEVLAAHPRTVFLVIGGGDLERTRELARDQGVLEAVRFTGFRADVERLLCALDVSVNCSSDGEGLTGAIRESMALGLPVVCTDVGGNSELVRNGGTGLLVASGDAPGLARAVLRLLDEPEEAARMAEQGRALVHQRMNNEYRCDQVMAFYRELLALRQGGAGGAGEPRRAGQGGGQGRS